MHILFFRRNRLVTKAAELTGHVDVGASKGILSPLSQGPTLNLVGPSAENLAEGSVSSQLAHTLREPLVDTGSPRQGEFRLPSWRNRLGKGFRRQT